MTKITIDRAIVEQALEFVTSEGWGTTPYMDVCVYEDAALLREALRVALAEQPQDWDELEALRRAGLSLIGLAEHDPYCEVFDLDDAGGHKACTCGLSNAIAVIKEAGKIAPTKTAPVQDWDEIEALRESLREHMAEIHRLRASSQQQAEPVQEPVLVVEKEPDYWSGGHFHQGRKSHIDPTKVWSLPIGTKLYTAPAKGESEGFVDAQVVYQISMKNGATSSAWIDVDEAAYNSAKVYGEYKCRCLYTGENNE